MPETVAFFRPDDERAAEAAEIVESLGAEPLSDPMLAVEPTGAAPREDADFLILTSKTGVELADEAGWQPEGSVVAIGSSTAAKLREAGYAVDRMPETYTSAGLVGELEADAPGARIEVARSDHGSPVLTDGLNDAGAYVHETVLYRLIRPERAGESAIASAEGDLAGACFTSSLTVEHFLDAAADRGIRDEAIEGLNRAVVGTIGPPTREVAETHGIEVDVVPEVAEFEALAEAVVDRL
ncbi:uroporphyrinogen-III synthase [Natronomonas salina]|uniref:uroporphyrinogen-III synthase n=1 Tax=Natronomonas salina TaxID=1710540 RepID=UPI0015B42D8E|nr:uroporphyrinogen-III synthase [Natronomonas salina]QLD88945.1 uroporphyrinogen-III synthase [Natronomonas salina]